MVRFAFLCSAALLASGCAHPPPALESFVPSGVTILAGADLDRVRASPAFSQLPAAWRAVMEPFAAARSLLVASNGKDILAILRGPFPTAPAGAIMAAPGIALAGPPDLVRAALARQKSGAPGPVALLAHAAPLRAAGDIWLVVRGGTVLPLSGNYGNVNRLLRDADFAWFTLRLGNPAEVAAVFEARDAAGATGIEQTLRALFTLMAAGIPRQAALFHSIRIARQAATVHAALSIPPADLSSLF